MRFIRDQHGSALFILIVTAGLSVGAALLMTAAAGKMEPSMHSARHSGQTVSAQLEKAKQALLAYAVTYVDNYPATGAGVGHFPCPDRDPIDDGVPTNDGPDPPCSRGATNVGRMPRYTFSKDAGHTRHQQKLIEFFPQKSLLDQQMWYVVSKAFINNPVSTVVNPATTAELNVDGVTNVVAVIIAPGPELAGWGQSRPSDRISDYLEGENADGDTDFSRLSPVQGNDQLVFITVEELLPDLLQRVQGYVVNALQDYSAYACDGMQFSCYPEELSSVAMLDEMPLKQHWFVRNRWQRFIDYELDPQCADKQEPPCQIISHNSAAQTHRPIRIVVKPGDDDN